MVRAIPEGYHTITPYLKVRNVGGLLEFVQQAFDAKVVEVLNPNGDVRHAEVQIGDSRLMMGECQPGHDPVPAMMYLYVEDVDAWFQRAVKAGAEVLDPPEDQFYGDRSGGVIDSWGNRWYLATHIEDLSQEEMDRRAALWSQGGEAD
ncbi:MAG: VOC family protein [Planctomycetota bacterium]|nr:MAG: VOC family protein [Planctomycetota bacterium]